MAETAQRCIAGEKWHSFNAPEISSTLAPAYETPDKAMQEHKRRFKMLF